MTRTEWVLEKLLDVLKGLMPHFRDQHSGLYDNCPEPKQYTFGVPDLRRATTMPIVAVDIDREELTQLTLGVAGKRRVTLPCLVYIFHSHRDPEQLLRQLLQLTDLAIHVLEHVPKTERVLYQAPRFVDLTPAIEMPDAPYLAASAVTVQALEVHQNP